MSEPTTSKISRPRARKRRMARQKIPNRADFTARVDKDLLAQVDAIVEVRRKSQPSFNRTDALHQALTLWVAAEAAKGGAT